MSDNYFDPQYKMNNTFCNKMKKITNRKEIKLLRREITKRFL